MRPDGTVSNTQPLSDGVGGIPENTLASNAQFGTAIEAGAGDLNGDGLRDVLVLSRHMSAVFILHMNVDDTVQSVRQLSTASGGGFESLGVSGLNGVNFGIAALSPRQPGNPVDLVMTDYNNFRLIFARLHANGTVIDGSVETVSNG